MKIKSLRKALKVAQQIFKNKDKIVEVLNDSTKKAEESQDKMSSGLWSDVKNLRDMLKAWMSGSFKMSKTTILYVIAGLIYFVNPMDLVPDFILGLGFLDDAAVLSIVVSRIKGEIDKYKEDSKYEDAEVIS
ncbi:MAG: YkvA family protein [Bacteroidia bacterium]